MRLDDFLMARIAEDEAVAREVEQRVAQGGALTCYEDANGSTPTAYFDRDYRQGGFTMSAARVLAECEAKRQIVEMVDWLDNYGGSVMTVLADRPSRLTLRLLVQPFRDHPDFDPEWRLA